MARYKETNEKMRAETTAEILVCALRLFAESGYAQTSTRVIAREAGVSTGLMYHYFDSKEALLRAVFDYCMQELETVFQNAYLQSPAGLRIANLLDAMFEVLRSDRQFWALFYMLRTQPAIMKILGADFRAWTDRLRQIFLHELADAGWEDADTESYMLYSLIEGTIQQYLLNPDTYPLDLISVKIIAQYSFD